MRTFFIFLQVLFLFVRPTSVLAQLDSTKIPLFMIDTYGTMIVDEPKMHAGLKIIYHENSYNRPDDPGNIYDGSIGIEIRGTYSASLPQKPYGLETRDVQGENLNVPLFHMPSENDWILLANYNDKTFMRNSLAFKLFRNMGHYAPRTQFCEVMVNGFYQGIYVFTEKIKKDKGRVNVATLNPTENTGDDLTGGYIFKVDYFDDNTSWVSNYHPFQQQHDDVHFVYHYPGAEHITEDQKNYIKNFVHKFETVLFSANTHQRQHDLYNLMDISSFIDYFIIGELSRNVDAYKKSSYFYKQKDSDGGKLFAGPVWDFDWAWKNLGECIFGAVDGSGWAYQVHTCNPWPIPPAWMARLLEEPYFNQQVNERYFDLRKSYLSKDILFNYIDSVAQVLDEAQERHYRRWPILGINVGAPEVDAQPTSYHGEIEKFKNWISTRLDWLDIHMPNFVVTGTEKFNSNTAYIYPNPSSDWISIHSNKPIQQYTVFGANGEARLSGSSASVVKLDIHQFAAGLYMVKIHHSDGTQWIGKFVKSG